MGQSSKSDRSKWGKLVGFCKEYKGKWITEMKFHNLLMTCQTDYLLSMSWCYKNNKPLSNIDIYKQKMLNFSKTFTKTKKTITTELSKWNIPNKIER